MGFILLDLAIFDADPAFDQIYATIQIGKRKILAGEISWQLPRRTGRHRAGPRIHYAPFEPPVASTSFAKDLGSLIRKCRFRH